MLVFSKLADGTRLRLQRGTRRSTMKDLPRSASASAWRCTRTTPGSSLRKVLHDIAPDGGIAALELRQRIDAALTLLPGLLIVALVIGPALWLAGLSFWSDGQLSLTHYQRMLANPSYASILLTTFNSPSS